MSEQIEVKYRKMTEKDLSFVYSSWLKSYRNSPFAKQMTNDVYYNNYKLVLKELLESPKVVVTIAHDVEDEDNIYGYCVIEVVNGVQILHYVYVKLALRGLGIGRRMCTGLLTDFGDKYTVTSHANTNFPFIKDKFRLLYNPFRG